MKRAFNLEIGKKYKNHNGSEYVCRANYSHSTVLERIKDSWTLEAHGICIYDDGTIEWDYSTGGHWVRDPLAQS